MITKTAQIRVTLPVQLQDLLQVKTSKFGVSISSYIRNLIINDVQNIAYPEYTLSQKSQNALKLADHDLKTGDTVKTTDVRSYLDEL